MGVIFSNAIAAALFYLRPHQALGSEGEADTDDGKQNKPLSTDHDDNDSDNSNSRLLESQECLLPVVDAESLTELGEAVRQTVSRYLGINSSQAKVYLKNPVNDQLVDGHNKQLPSSCYLSEVLSQRGKAVISASKKEDCIADLLGNNHSNDSGSHVFLLPIPERGTHKSNGLVVVESQSSSISNTDTKRLELCIKQAAVTYEAIKARGNITPRAESDPSPASLLSLIQLCSDMNDQDVIKLQQKVMRYLCQHIGAETGFILLLVPETQELFCQSVGGDKTLQQEIRFDGAHSDFAQALESKQPFSLTDLPEDGKAMVEKVSGVTVKSFLCVPVTVSGGKELLALTCMVNKNNDQDFANADIEMIHQCFKYTSTIISSTLAFQNERKLKNQTQALLQVAKKLFTRLGKSISPSESPRLLTDLSHASPVELLNIRGEGLPNTHGITPQGPTQGLVEKRHQEKTVHERNTSTECQDNAVMELSKNRSDIWQENNQLFQTGDMKEKYFERKTPCLGDLFSHPAEKEQTGTNDFSIEGKTSLLYLLRSSTNCYHLSQQLEQGLHSHMREIEGLLHFYHGDEVKENDKHLRDVLTCETHHRTVMSQTENERLDLECYNKHLHSSMEETQLISQIVNLFSSIDNNDSSDLLISPDARLEHNKLVQKEEEVEILGKCDGKDELQSILSNKGFLTGASKEEYDEECLVQNDYNEETNVQADPFSTLHADSPILPKDGNPFLLNDNKSTDYESVLVGVASDESLIDVSNKDKDTHNVCDEALTNDFGNDKALVEHWNEDVPAYEACEGNLYSTADEEFFGQLDREERFAQTSNQDVDNNDHTSNKDFHGHITNEEDIGPFLVVEVAESASEETMFHSVDNSGDEEAFIGTFGEVVFACNYNEENFSLAMNEVIGQPARKENVHSSPDVAVEDSYGEDILFHLMDDFDCEDVLTESCHEDMDGVCSHCVGKDNHVQSSHKDIHIDNEDDFAPTNYGIVRCFSEEAFFDTLDERDNKIERNDNLVHASHDALCENERFVHSAWDESLFVSANENNLVYAPNTETNEMNSLYFANKTSDRFHSNKSDIVPFRTEELHVDTASENRGDLAETTRGEAVINVEAACSTIEDKCHVEFTAKEFAMNPTNEEDSPHRANEGNRNMELVENDIVDSAADIGDGIVAIFDGTSNSFDMCGDTDVMTEGIDVTSENVEEYDENRILSQSELVLTDGRCHFSDENTDMTSCSVDLSNELIDVKFDDSVNQINETKDSTRGSFVLSPSDADIIDKPIIADGGRFDGDSAIKKSGNELGRNIQCKMLTGDEACDCGACGTALSDSSWVVVGDVSEDGKQHLSHSDSSLDLFHLLVTDSEIGQNDIGRNCPQHDHNTDRIGRVECRSNLNQEALEDESQQDLSKSSERAVNLSSDLFCNIDDNLVGISEENIILLEGYRNNQKTYTLDSSTSEECFAPPGIDTLEETGFDGNRLEEEDYLKPGASQLAKSSASSTTSGIGKTDSLSDWPNVYSDSVEENAWKEEAGLPEMTSNENYDLVELISQSYKDRHGKEMHPGAILYDSSHDCHPTSELMGKDLVFGSSRDLEIENKGTFPVDTEDTIDCHPGIRDDRKGTQFSFKESNSGEDCVCRDECMCYDNVCCPLNVSHRTNNGNCALKKANDVEWSSGFQCHSESTGCLFHFMDKKECATLKDLSIDGGVECLIGLPDGGHNNGFPDEGEESKGCCLDDMNNHMGKRSIFTEGDKDHTEYSIHFEDNKESSLKTEYESHIEIADDKEYLINVPDDVHDKEYPIKTKDDKACLNDAPDDTDDKEYPIKVTDDKEYRIETEDDKECLIDAPDDTDDKEYPIKITDDKEYRIETEDDKECLIDAPDDTDDKEYPIKITDDKEYRIETEDDKECLIDAPDDINDKECVTEDNDNKEKCLIDVLDAKEKETRFTGLPCRTHIEGYCNGEKNSIDRKICHKDDLKDKENQGFSLEYEVSKALKGCPVDNGDGTECWLNVLVGENGKGCHVDSINRTECHDPEVDVYKECFTGGLSENVHEECAINIVSDKVDKKGFSNVLHINNDPTNLINDINVNDENSIPGNADPDTTNHESFPSKSLDSYKVVDEHVNKNCSNGVSLSSFEVHEIECLKSCQCNATVDKSLSIEMSCHDEPLAQSTPKSQVNEICQAAASQKEKHTSLLFLSFGDSTFCSTDTGSTKESNVVPDKDSCNILSLSIDPVDGSKANEIAGALVLNEETTDAGTEAVFSLDPNGIKNEFDSFTPSSEHQFVNKQEKSKSSPSVLGKSCTKNPALSCYSDNRFACQTVSSDPQNIQDDEEYALSGLNSLLYGSTFDLDSSSKMDVYEKKYDLCTDKPHSTQCAVCAAEGPVIKHFPEFEDLHTESCLTAEDSSSDDNTTTSISSAKYDLETKHGPDPHFDSNKKEIPSADSKAEEAFNWKDQSSDHHGPLLPQVEVMEGFNEPLQKWNSSMLHQSVTYDNTLILQPYLLENCDSRGSTRNMVPFEKADGLDLNLIAEEEPNNVEPQSLVESCPSSTLFVTGVDDVSCTNGEYVTCDDYSKDEEKSTSVMKSNGEFPEGDSFMCDDYLKLDAILIPNSIGVEGERVGHCLPTEDRPVLSKEFAFNLKRDLKLIENDVLEKGEPNGGVFESDENVEPSLCKLDELDNEFEEKVELMQSEFQFEFEPKVRKFRKSVESNQSEIGVDFDLKVDQLSIQSKDSSTLDVTGPNESDLISGDDQAFDGDISCLDEEEGENEQGTCHATALEDDAILEMWDESYDVNLCLNKQPLFSTSLDVNEDFEEHIINHSQEFGDSDGSVGFMDDSISVQGAMFFQTEDTCVVGSRAHGVILGACINPTGIDTMKECGSKALSMIRPNKDETIGTGGNELLDLSFGESCNSSVNLDSFYFTDSQTEELENWATCYKKDEVKTELHLVDTESGPESKVRRKLKYNPIDYDTVSFGIEESEEGDEIDPLVTSDDVHSIQYASADDVVADLTCSNVKNLPSNTTIGHSGCEKASLYSIANIPCLDYVVMEQADELHGEPDFELKDSGRICDFGTKREDTHFPMSAFNISCMQNPGNYYSDRDGSERGPMCVTDEVSDRKHELSQECNSDLATGCFCSGKRNVSKPRSPVTKKLPVTRTPIEKIDNMSLFTNKQFFYRQTNVANGSASSDYFSVIRDDGTQTGKIVPCPFNEFEDSVEEAKATSIVIDYKPFVTHKKSPYRLSLSSTLTEIPEEGNGEILCCSLSHDSSSCSSSSVNASTNINGRSGETVGRKGNGELHNLLEEISFSTSNGGYATNKSVANYDDVFVDEFQESLSDNEVQNVEVSGFYGNGKFFENNSVKENSTVEETSSRKERIYPKNSGLVVTTKGLFEEHADDPDFDFKDSVAMEITVDGDAQRSVSVLPEKLCITFQNDCFDFTDSTCIEIGNGDNGLASFENIATQNSEMFAADSCLEMSKSLLDKSSVSHEEMNPCLSPEESVAESHCILSNESYTELLVKKLDKNYEERFEDSKQTEGEQTYLALNNKGDTTFSNKNVVEMKTMMTEHCTCMSDIVVKVKIELEPVGCPQHNHIQTRDEGFGEKNYCYSSSLPCLNIDSISDTQSHQMSQNVSSDVLNAMTTEQERHSTFYLCSKSDTEVQRSSFPRTVKHCSKTGHSHNNNDQPHWERKESKFERQMADIYHRIRETSGMAEEDITYPSDAYYDMSFVNCGDASIVDNNTSLEPSSDYLNKTFCTCKADNDSEKEKYFAPLFRDGEYKLIYGEVERGELEACDHKTEGGHRLQDGVLKTAYFVSGACTVGDNEGDYGENELNERIVWREVSGKEEDGDGKDEDIADDLDASSAAYSDNMDSFTDLDAQSVCDSLESKSNDTDILSMSGTRNSINKSDTVDVRGKEHSQDEFDNTGYSLSDDGDLDNYRCIADLTFNVSEGEDMTNDPQDELMSKKQKDESGCSVVDEYSDEHERSILDRTFDIGHDDGENCLDGVDLGYPDVSHTTQEKHENCFSDGSGYRAHIVFKDTHATATEYKMYNSSKEEFSEKIDGVEAILQLKGSPERKYFTDIENLSCLYEGIDRSSNVICKVFDIERRDSSDIGAKLVHPFPADSGESYLKDMTERLPIDGEQKDKDCTLEWTNDLIKGEEVENAFWNSMECSDYKSPRVYFPDIYDVYETHMPYDKYTDKIDFGHNRDQMVSVMECDKVCRSNEAGFHEYQNLCSNRCHQPSLPYQYAKTNKSTQALSRNRKIQANQSLSDEISTCIKGAVCKYFSNPFADFQSCDEEEECIEDRPDNDMFDREDGNAHIDLDTQRDVGEPHSSISQVESQCDLHSSFEGYSPCLQQYRSPVGKYFTSPGDSCLHHCNVFGKKARKSMTYADVDQTLCSGSEHYILKTDCSCNKSVCNQGCQCFHSDYPFYEDMNKDNDERRKDFKNCWPPDAFPSGQRRKIVHYNHETESRNVFCSVDDCEGNFGGKEVLATKQEDRRMPTLALSVEDNACRLIGLRPRRVVRFKDIVGSIPVRCDTDLLFDDLTKLLREIMQEARNLTDAERCSVFLIDKDTDELVAMVFDGITAEDKERLLRGLRTRQDAKHKKTWQFGTGVQGEIRLPKTQGIAGHVATTGTLLNIRDAYSHPLFYRGIDDSTGFRTRNILCFPIKDEEGVVLGVAQLCNKKTFQYFTTFDEDIASAFAVYCCISISHSLMYKKVIDIQYRNSLANELMMFHMKSLMYKKLQDTQHRQRLANDLMMFHLNQQVPGEEVTSMANMTIPHISKFSINFDSFDFAPRTIPEHQTVLSCLSMFEDLGFMQRWRIKLDTLVRFVLMVKKGYRNPPYHNWMHAYAVTHFCYLLIKNLHLHKYLEDIELLALFVSCMCHDIDHRGTTNSFQVQSQTVLAALYSSEGSVMERHHLAQSMCILNTEGSNLFEQLSSKEYQTVLDMMKEIILATDLAHHLRTVKEQDHMSTSGTYSKANPNDRYTLLCLLMTACDLSDQTKNWKNTKLIASLVYQEFFSQGDLEKALGKNPLEMMDRERACIPELQIAFLDNIAAPVYKILVQMFPEAEVVQRNVEDNRKHWVHIRELLKSKHGKSVMNVEEIISLEEDPGERMKGSDSGDSMDDEVDDNSPENSSSNNNNNNPTLINGQ